MKKTILIIFAILIISVVVYYLTIGKDNIEQDEAINKLMDKWEDFAKKHSSTVIDRPAVKKELDKLPPEDIATLDKFTDNAVAAKSAVDYLAMAGDILAAREIFKKTNLSNVIQGLFPGVFK